MGLRQSTEVVKTPSKQQQQVPPENDTKEFYQEHLQKLTTENKILMFSKTTCTYCTQAKRLLDDLKLEYKTIELDLDANCPNDNCQKLATALMLQTRIRTVPQIFINGKCIGGFSDLEMLSKNEKHFQDFLNNFSNIDIDKKK